MSIYLDFLSLWFRIEMMLAYVVLVNAMPYLDRWLPPMKMRALQIQTIGIGIMAQDGLKGMPKEVSRKVFREKTLVLTFIVTVVMMKVAN